MAATKISEILAKEHAAVALAIARIGDCLDEAAREAVAGLLRAKADLAISGDDNVAADWLGELADEIMKPNPSRTWNAGECRGLGALIESDDPSHIASEITNEHYIGSGDPFVTVQERRDESGKLLAFTLLRANTGDYQATDEALSRLVKELLTANG